MTTEMMTDTDKIVEEVLFRIPPDDPMTLVHAALVCKQWRRLLSDPGFRDYHGTPPMLGVLCNSKYANATYKSRFIPTSSFRSPHTIASEFRVVDARHGRVLLRTNDWRCSFAVWDPVKDEITCELPEPPFAGIQDPKHGGVAAVLCAVVDGCDHLHCQGGPFRVVYVSEEMFACVYSSEDGVWRELSSSAKGYVDTASLPGELIGNTLHFVCGNLGTNKILKYDLATCHASFICTPTSSYGYASPGVLMTTEEGGLGFATVEDCRVHLWSRQQPTNLDEEADGDQWALTRVIGLPTVLPAELVGFASGVRVLFYTTTRGIHAMDLKSGRVTTISKSVGFNCVFPYTNFYPF